MTYFNFPHIEEDDNLKNLRNENTVFICLMRTDGRINLKPKKTVALKGFISNDGCLI